MVSHSHLGRNMRRCLRHILKHMRRCLRHILKHMRCLRHMPAVSLGATNCLGTWHNDVLGVRFGSSIPSTSCGCRSRFFRNHRKRNDARPGIASLRAFAPTHPRSPSRTHSRRCCLGVWSCPWSKQRELTAACTTSGQKKKTVGAHKEKANAAMLGRYGVIFRPHPSSRPSPP